MMKKISTLIDRHSVTAAFVFATVGTIAIIFVARAILVGTPGNIVKMEEERNLMTGRVWIQVSCAQWYQPGLHRTRFFLTQQSSAHEVDSTAVERAEAYFKVLDETKCEPSKTTTVKVK